LSKIRINFHENQGKIWRPTFAEKQMKTLFWKSHQNEVFVIFVGEKFVGKSCTTTFRASLGKFRQKSFALQNICLLLHLWFCTWF